MYHNVKKRKGKRTLRYVLKEKDLQICADPLTGALRILRELTAATVDDCLRGRRRRRSRSRRSMKTVRKMMSIIPKKIIW